MKYATIKNNKVQEIFETDDLVLIYHLQQRYDDVVEIGKQNVSVGFIYDQADKKFIEPMPEVIESPTPKTTNTLSVYEFRSRFTQDEKVAIYEAATNNTLIKIFLDDLLSASNVDVSNQELISSLDYMVSKGLLKSNRKTEILKPKLL